MQPQQSDWRWFVTEAAALGRCAKQAWTMVPKRHRVSLAAAAILMAMNSLSYAIQSQLLGSLVDRIDKGRETLPASTLFWSAMELLGVIAALYVMREAFNVARRYMVEGSCTALNRDMQLRLVDHILHYDMANIYGEKIGTLHGRIFRSVDGLIHFVRIMFLDFLPAILTGIFTLGAALRLQPLVGLVMAGVAPISVFLTLRQLKTQMGVRLQLMRDCEAVDGLVVEQLSGFEYIRVAHTEALEGKRLAGLTELRRQRELKHHFEMSLFGSGKALNEGFFYVCVLALSTYLAINGQISFGDIVTFSALYLGVMTPLNEIHRVIDLGHESSLRMLDLQAMLGKPRDRSYDLATAPETTLNSESLPPRLSHGQPVIRLSSVTARYNSDGHTPPALWDVNLEIQPGQCIGVAGLSGGGKSSMIKTLLRLLHPDSGTIELMGYPIDQIDRRQLAEWIGYVGQNPFVFAGTVRENITYGVEESDADNLEAVQRAAMSANIHDEIMAMPKGYDTPVSERGGNLSGGQRQRLAIARLLLRTSPILILDEATSALDNISERRIQRSLDIRGGQQTIIMIAHRLSTLRHCDSIYVFESGRVVESGGYGELIAAQGRFAELVRAGESDLHAPV